jgi:hypothetical protein
MEREHQCELVPPGERLHLWVSVVTEHVAAALEDDPDAFDSSRWVEQSDFIATSGGEVFVWLRSDRCLKSDAGSPERLPAQYDHKTNGVHRSHGTAVYRTSCAVCCPASTAPNAEAGSVVGDRTLGR